MSGKVAECEGCIIYKYTFCNLSVDEALLITVCIAVILKLMTFSAHALELQYTGSINFSVAGHKVFVG